MKKFTLTQSWTSEYSEAPTNVEVTLTQDQMTTILKHIDYLRSLGEFDGTRIEMIYLDIQVVDNEYRIGHSTLSIGQYRMYVEVVNKWNNEDRAEYEGISVSDLTNKINPLTQPIKEIKDKVKEKFSQGISDFRMSVKVPRGNAHIDEVIDEIEETTNLSVSRSNLCGLGLDYKDNDYSYWTIQVMN